MHSEDLSTTTIIHREYIEDVLAGTGTPTVFTLQSFPCNPGQSASFPWLSVASQNWLYYDFEELTFEFISTSATSFSSATNIALGTVIGRHEDDPTIPVDGSLAQMLNSFGAETAKPAESWKYHVHLDKTRMGHYTIRTGSQPTNTDLRMYDQGYFEIASSGLPQASVNFGQLWVSYKVHLYRPFYIAGLIGQTIRCAHYQSTAATFTNAAPLGTVALTTAANSRGDTIGLTFTSTVINFPITISTGTYMVWIRWQANSTAALVAPTLSATNGTLRTGIFTGAVKAGFNIAPNDGETSVEMTETGFIAVNAPGSSQCSITVGGAGTLPTGGTEILDIIVVQYNPNNV